MANYYGLCRTNYFGVTDPEAFKAICERIVGDEGVPAIVITDGEGENKKYGFYMEASLIGLEPEKIDEPENEDDYECIEYDAYEVAEAIQPIIKEGDACIITEIGNEKMRYLQGFAFIVTREKISTVSLYDASMDKAREMLGNKDWTTKNEY